MVLYKPRFHCLPTELDVSHNNEGGILAQKGSKSAIVQLKTGRGTVFPGCYPQVTVKQLE